MMILTLSPMLHWLSSSWAMILEVFLRVTWYLKLRTHLSTATRTDFCMRFDMICGKLKGEESVSLLVVYECGGGSVFDEEKNRCNHITYRSYFLF
jgi:hypothetical protein